MDLIFHLSDPIEHPRPQVCTQIHTGRLFSRELTQESLEAESLLVCLVAAVGSRYHQSC